MILKIDTDSLERLPQKLAGLTLFDSITLRRQVIACVAILFCSNSHKIKLTYWTVSPPTYLCWRTWSFLPFCEDFPSWCKAVHVLHETRIIPLCQKRFWSWVAVERRASSLSGCLQRGVQILILKGSYDWTAVSGHICITTISRWVSRKHPNCCTRNIIIFIWSPAPSQQSPRQAFFLPGSHQIAFKDSLPIFILT